MALSRLKLNLWSVREFLVAASLEFSNIQGDFWIGGEVKERMNSIVFGMLNN